MSKHRRPTDVVARLDSLTMAYDGRSVVQEVSLELVRGRAYFLVGPNGSGKSTTVETLVGLRRPYSGQAQLLGRPSGDPSLRPHIRVCLQGASLHPQVTVGEHFDFVASLFGTANGGIEDIAAQFGIVELLPRRYGKLSGGQQRRVQVAACMFGESEFILLDEPTSGVDIESRLSLWSSLRSAMTKNPNTLLATTHDLSEAEDYADEVIVMRAGRIVAQGAPTEIVAATGLDGVLMVPTSAAGDLQAQPSAGRQVLTADAGTTTLGYLDRAALSRDVAWLAERQVHASERSPRLSDAYLLTFGATSESS